MPDHIGERWVVIVVRALPCLPCSPHEYSGRIGTAVTPHGFVVRFESAGPIWGSRDRSRHNSPGRIRTAVIGSKGPYDWPLHHGTTVVRSCRSFNDILLGVNAEVSTRSGPGGPDTNGGKIPPHGRTPVRARYVSPHEGCGGFGVPTGTRYLLAQRPKPHRTTAHSLSVDGHGPCHRPACPFCHGGQARTPPGLDWSCRRPIPCCRGRGTVSAGWRVSAGTTPVFPD